MYEVRMVAPRPPIAAHPVEQLDTWLAAELRPLMAAHRWIALGTRHATRAKKLREGHTEPRVSDLARVLDAGGSLPAVLSILDELRHRLEARARARESQRATRLASVTTKETSEAIVAVIAAAERPDCPAANAAAIREVAEGIHALTEQQHALFARRVTLAQAGRPTRPARYPDRPVVRRATVGRAD